MFKKMFLFFSLVAFFVIFATAPSVIAEDKWFTSCSIDKIGVLSDGSTYVKLTDDTDTDAFSDYPFITASQSMDNKVLATLLTAQSMQSNVSIYADNSTKPGVISIIVIVNK